MGNCCYKWDSSDYRVSSNAKSGWFHNNNFFFLSFSLFWLTFYDFRKSSFISFWCVLLKICLDDPFVSFHSRNGIFIFFFFLFSFWCFPLFFNILSLMDIIVKSFLFWSFWISLLAFLLITLSNGFPFNWFLFIGVIVITYYTNLGGFNFNY